MSNSGRALAARAMLRAHSSLLSLATLLGPGKKGVGDGGVDILLTGTFHSKNWIRSHLVPLSRCRRCRTVRVVTRFPIPPLDKVEAVVPGERLSRLIGEVPARLLTFLVVALKSRPHAVGGFHLLVNGLAASLLGRASGARSIYFCVGGPAEVQGGGVLSENRFFGKLPEPHPGVESDLLRTVSGFDLVVTMGTRAKAFFRGNGVDGDIRVIPGGVNAPASDAGSGSPAWDVVFVGRLVPVKRVDLLLRALSIVRNAIPGVRAVIVGDGPLRADLEREAASLGLGDAVEFAGQREDVSEILGRSKLFALTSETEGLSLALMEAMAAGLPAVVPDVGDLGDLVLDGENGFLVRDGSPEAFAERIEAVLRDGALRERLSCAASGAMERYGIPQAARQWDSVLESWGEGRGGGCAE